MTNKSLLGMDFDALGYQTGLQTRDEERTKAICGQHIATLEEEVRPEQLRLEAEIEDIRASGEALSSQLYQRPSPVRDGLILSRLRSCKYTLAILVPVLLTSLISHTLTFLMLGWSLLVSVPAAIALTGIATASGHFLWNAVVDGRRWLLMPALACSGLCLFALVEMAQARNAMVRVAASAKTEAPESFVAESAVDPMPEKDMKSESSLESVEGYLGQAMTKLMIVADALAGLLLGLATSILTDPDVVMWRLLRRLKTRLAGVTERRDELASIISRAKRQCTAGILRAFKNELTHPPFLRILPLVVLMAGTATIAGAQPDIRRHEAILIDLSGSIARKSANSDLFRDYFNAVRNLLKTEPPGSRVWVESITTESFGSVQTLVRGWTPTPKGVFTDPLQRARQQLVASLENRFSGVSPTAAGTDIIGGLFRTKTLMESDTSPDSRRTAKEIFIVSDMVNESGELSMPAAAPSGATRMLETVRNNHLIVPLSGYRVHVLGAGPAGLTPQLWSEVRQFWTLYFQASGAQLVEYSSEAFVNR